MGRKEFCIERVDQTAPEDGPVHFASCLGYWPCWHEAWLCNIKITANHRPPGLGFGVFPSHLFVSHHLLAATTSPNDGLKISTTERTRWWFIEVE